MYFVYILQSESNQHYYIGQTQDLELRLIKHNSNGNTSTRNKGPWKIVYSKSYETRAEAIKEESRIKKQKSRKYIESLINASG